MSAQTPSKDRQQNTITVVFLDDNKTCPIKLDDSKQARAFLKLQPLELSLSDFNGTEKIATLPKKLSLDEEPEGFEPKRGDVTYYIPWGNLAIFYKDFRYSEHLVHLGKLGDCMDNFPTGNTIPIRIETD